MLNGHHSHRGTLWKRDLRPRQAPWSQQSSETAVKDALLPQIFITSRHFKCERISQCLLTLLLHKETLWRGKTDVQRLLQLKGHIRYCWIFTVQILNHVSESIQIRLCMWLFSFYTLIFGYFWNIHYLTSAVTKSGSTVRITQDVQWDSPASPLFSCFSFRVVVVCKQAQCRYTLWLNCCLEAK